MDEFDTGVFGQWLIGQARGISLRNGFGGPPILDASNKRGYNGNPGLRTSYSLDKTEDEGHIRVDSIHRFESVSSAYSSCGSGNFDEDPGTGDVKVIDVFNEGTGFGEDSAVRESKTWVDRYGNSTRDY